MTAELESPVNETTKDISTEVNLGNKVVLYNDEWHTFEQVVNQIVVAINCSEQEAFKIAYMVDRNGSAVVYKGGIEDCLRVSTILQEIQLKTEIVG